MKTAEEKNKKEYSVGIENAKNSADSKMIQSLKLERANQVEIYTHEMTAHERRVASNERMISNRRSEKNIVMSVLEKKYGL